MSRREAFLAGDRPDDVALFLAESFVDGDLDDHAERVDGGWLLVVDGDRGRAVFRRATGMDAMAFAREAADERASVARDLTDGDCPADGTDHSPQFVFAFVEEQNEAVGGVYAEGAVVHAYAHCDCGQSYSERWVAGAD